MVNTSEDKNDLRIYLAFHSYRTQKNVAYN